MRHFSSKQLRKLFLNFFKSKNHTIIPSASLIPENDPSVLFTTAGMHPLVPYLMGEKHTGGKRLANVQKCVRTSDISNVGDGTHNTFFEMLGNWSLGDYFKKEAIEWSYEFLTSEKYLGLPNKKLAVSVFGGDKDAPKDEEASEIWKQVGIPKNKIVYLGKDDNWWPAGGKSTGPQGPDTEIFYWIGRENAPAYFDTNDKRWVEIWNDVFMQYIKNPDGSFKELKQKNVDTGMGLERLTMIMQNKNSVYETDLFLPIIETIEKISGKNYKDNIRTMRVIADHMRAATFILGDQHAVVPSNVDQGYVLRRLIRRSIVFGRKLNIQKRMTSAIAQTIVAEYSEDYNELKKNKVFILEELEKEEAGFEKTLKNGLKRLEKLLDTTGAGEKISGKEAFELFSTFGFPLELTMELAKEKNINVDTKMFDEEFKLHQTISRKGAQQKFAGGLIDHSMEVVRLHTATHLLHKALQKILGQQATQKGSNITRERLRFDFSYPQKLTEEQKKQVENLVNDAIKKDYNVHWEEMTVDEAKKQNAIGFFDDKYAQLGNKIKVYIIGDEEKGYFSKEICGGPHVEHTGELKNFKIIKEEAVSKGIRRIKAVINQ